MTIPNPRRPALRDLEPGLDDLARAVALKDVDEVFEVAVRVVQAYSQFNGPRSSRWPPRGRPLLRSGRVDLDEPKLILVDG